MSLKDKIKHLRDLKQRGIERTEQMKAEKLRKKFRKAMDRKPGAVKAISDGIALKKSPLTVMGEEYSRRRYESKERQKK